MDVTRIVVGVFQRIGNGIEPIVQVPRGLGGDRITDRILFSRGEDPREEELAVHIGLDLQIDRRASNIGSGQRNLDTRQGQLFRLLHAVTIGVDVSDTRNITRYRVDHVDFSQSFSLSAIAVLYDVTERVIIVADGLVPSVGRVEHRHVIGRDAGGTVLGRHGATTNLGSAAVLTDQFLQRQDFVNIGSNRIVGQDNQLLVDEVLECHQSILIHTGTVFIEHHRRIVHVRDLNRYQTGVAEPSPAKVGNGVGEGLGPEEVRFRGVPDNVAIGRNRTTLTGNPQIRYDNRISTVVRIGFANKVVQLDIQLVVGRIFQNPREVRIDSGRTIVDIVDH